MSAPARALAAIDRFFAPQPMQALVIARVAIGGVLFCAWAARLADVPEVYGPRGLGGADTLKRLPEASFGRALEAPIEWLAHVPSEASIWLLYALLLVASLSFALGCFTRASGLVAVALHALFHARAPEAFSGWAILIKPWALYVVLSNAGRFASIDAWRRRAREGPVPPETWSGPGWPVRLLQIHVCLLYAVAGIARLSDPAWLGGEMVFASLTDRTFGRWDVDWYPFFPLLRIPAYVALALEPLAPLLLWIPATRTLCALLLISLHAGLELAGTFGWWHWLMMPLLTVFLPPSWVAWALRRVLPRSLGGG
jgi:hypothetical protein